LLFDTYLCILDVRISTEIADLPVMTFLMRSVLLFFAAFCCLLVALTSSVLSQNADYELVEKLCGKCSSGDQKACSRLEDIARLNTNFSVRIDAVRCIENQFILSLVAQTDKEYLVRKAAVEKLDNENALMIVVMKDDDTRVRECAIRKIKDPVKLIKLYNIGDWTDRHEIITELDDMPFLEDLARDPDADLGDRKLVIYWRIKDQVVLTELALYDPESEIRKEAALKIKDQQVLSRIALNDRSHDVREAAADRLDDSLARTKAEINEKALEARKKATDTITGQAMLVKIVLEDKDDKISHDALMKISDQEQLARIVRAGGSWKIKKEAMERISDTVILKQFVSDYPDLLFLRVKDKFISKFCPERVNSDFSWITYNAYTGSKTNGILEEVKGNKCYWCNGAKQTWAGKFENIRGVIAAIESDSLDPLTFEVSRRDGYVYRKGKGSVTLKNGGTINYPPSPRKENGIKVWEGSSTWNGLDVAISFTSNLEVTKVGNLNLMISCPGEKEGIHIEITERLDVDCNQFGFIVGDAGRASASFDPVTNTFNGTFKALMELHCKDKLIISEGGTWTAVMKDDLK
jgi:hypothetical protein